MSADSDTERLIRLVHEMNQYKTDLAIIWSEQELAGDEFERHQTDEALQRLITLGAMERDIMLQRLFHGVLPEEEIYRRVFGDKGSA